MAGQCTYRDVYAPALSRIDVVVFVQARIEPGVPRSILLECRRHYGFQARIAHPNKQVRPSVMFFTAHIGMHTGPPCSRSMLAPFFKHIDTGVRIRHLGFWGVRTDGIYRSSILELGLTCPLSIGREVYPSDVGRAHNLAEYVFHILGRVPSRRILAHSSNQPSSAASESTSY